MPTAAHQRARLGIHVSSSRLPLFGFILFFVKYQGKTGADLLEKNILPAPQINGHFPNDEAGGEVNLLGVAKHHEEMEDVGARVEGGDEAVRDSLPETIRPIGLMLKPPRT